MTAKELSDFVTSIAPILERQIAHVVELEVQKRLATLPLPAGPMGPPGPPGEPGAQGDFGPQGPQGLPGEPGPRGESGLQGTKGDLGERGPEGVQGAMGRDGRDGINGEKGERGEKGLDGRDGVDGIHGKDGLGFDDLDWAEDDRGRLSVKFVRGDLVKTHRLPGLVDCGVWRPETGYLKGDGVTWNNSFWIAQADSTGDKPGEGSTPWRLAVRQGREGKPGAKGEPGPQGLRGEKGLDGRHYSGG